MAKRMPTPKPIQTPMPKQNGTIGGKTRVPANIQQFTVEELRGTGEQGRSLRELREISKNRKKPDYNPQQNPMPRPKEGHT